MKLSKQARREAKALYRSCQTDGVLDQDRLRRALQQVVETKPRGYLPILEHFRRLVKLDLEGRMARIESPFPLAPETHASLQAGLARIYGPGLTFSFTQNPALIGGLRIKVGSDVYDGTIQARLEQLQASF